MSNYTNNFNLKKPHQDDYYNIDDFNENFDIIDDELNKLSESNKKTQETINNFIKGETIEKIKASNVSIQDTGNNFDSSDVEGALQEVMEEVKKALQNGVDIKDAVRDAINSKLTVPELPNNATWNDIINSIIQIKEGRGNAQTGDVLQGKTFTNDSGQELTGTMPDRGSGGTITPSTQNQTKPKGYYSSDIVVVGDTDLNPNNIKKGVNIFGVTGNVIQATGNAQPNQVLNGVTYSDVNGQKIGTMPNRGGARTIIPSTKDQVIPWGFNSGDVTVKGSNTLKAEYIKYGINIFGVIGTLETGYTGSVKEAKTINLSNNYSLSFTYNLYNKRPITIRITPTSTFKTSQDSKYTFNQYVGVIKPYVNSYSIYFHADLIFAVYYYEDNRNDTIDITFTGGGHTNPTGSLKVEFIQ